LFPEKGHDLWIQGSPTRSAGVSMGRKRGDPPPRIEGERSPAPALMYCARGEKKNEEAEKRDYKKIKGDVLDQNTVTGGRKEGVPA